MSEHGKIKIYFVVKFCPEKGKRFYLFLTPYLALSGSFSYVAGYWSGSQLLKFFVCKPNIEGQVF